MSISKITVRQQTNNKFGVLVTCKKYIKLTMQDLHRVTVLKAKKKNLQILARKSNQNSIELQSTYKNAKSE